MYDPDFDWDELDGILQESEDIVSGSAVALGQDTQGKEPCDAPLYDDPKMDHAMVRRWQTHAAQANAVRLDNFSFGTWPSFRLYTGCWDEGVLRCWTVPSIQHDSCSKDSQPSVPKQPQLLAEARAGGFLNDLAVLGPGVLLVAASAGLMPTPGESLQVCRLGRLDQTNHEAPKDECVSPVTQLGSGQVPGGPAPQKVFLHVRGCRAVSVWPYTAGRSVPPQLAASISKDLLATSRVSEDGSSLATPGIWRVQTPHGGAEVGAVLLCRREAAARLWSGGCDGLVRLWDATVGTSFPVASCPLSPRVWVRHLECTEHGGLVVASHSDGVAFLDSREATAVLHVRGQGQAYSACAPGHALGTLAHTLLVCLGHRLVYYDLRCLGMHSNGPPILQEWKLPTTAVGLDAVSSAGLSTTGDFLAVAGCKGGETVFVA